MVAYKDVVVYEFSKLLRATIKSFEEVIEGAECPRFTALLEGRFHKFLVDNSLIDEDELAVIDLEELKSIVKQEMKNLYHQTDSLKTDVAWGVLLNSIYTASCRMEFDYISKNELVAKLHSLVMEYEVTDRECELTEENQYALDFLWTVISELQLDTDMILYNSERAMNDYPLQRAELLAVIERVRSKAYDRFLVFEELASEIKFS